jgi:DNA-binding Xre family transcriptional regulator
MITCRLAVVLAERRIKQQYPYVQIDVVRESGLNPNTISNLVNNITTRYDAHVLDALCRVLDVEPGDILAYAPDES